MSKYILPNFLIIGAARSGTTGLYNNIIQHPEISMPLKKEIHFFSYQYDKGIDFYSKYFKGFNSKMIGEASVSYTYPNKEDVAKRISDVLGENIKIIYILREPVARTLSHYNYYRYYGLNEKMDIEEALNKNPIYIETSKYSNFIKQYRKYFKSENIHIMLFEDYIKYPAEELAKLFRFMDIDDKFIPDDYSTKTNVSFKYRNKLIYDIYFKLSRSKFRFSIENMIRPGKRKMTRNVIRKIIGSNEQDTVPQYITQGLNDEFSNEISVLEEMLGRDLSIWKKER